MISDRARGTPAAVPSSPLVSPAPRLDLGKKVSTPQDVMLEELSLSTNRGSQLFQQRQRRMQRFVFEHPSGYRKVGAQLRAGWWPRALAGDAEGQQSFHSELHVAASPQAVVTHTHTHTTPPPGSPRSTERHLCPLAGYSGPLREVPPEKFNVTAIPKGYRSPWHGLLGDKDKAVGRENHSLLLRCRTPTPFDRAVLSDLFYVPAAELDNLSGLELISQRRNFNRVPQGWARVLPESDEL
uniref:Myozenin 3 n=1 Tax=Anser brachyrhynchus TaxID=132585 RepID=A0A8B9CHW0_9AVES